MKSLSLSLLSIFFALLCTGCSGQFLTKRNDLVEKFKASSNNVLNSGELSAETTQELRIEFLEKSYEEDPEKTLAILEEKPIAGRQVEQAHALAEAAFLHAMKLYNSGKRVDSAKYYLMAAANSYDFLFHNTDPLSHSFVAPYGRYMTQIYNVSLTRIVDIRETEKTNWTLPWKMQIGNTIYEFSRNPDTENQLEKTHYDEIVPAYETEVSGLNNFYQSEGIGAPMVGKRKNVKGNPDYSPFYPPMRSSPMTVLFQFSPRMEGAKLAKDGVAVRQVTVSILNPFKKSTVTINNKEFPLEADYSTAFGVMLTAANPGQYVLDMLMNAEKHMDKVGLVLTQPYDPNKIPVVLVHGLYSAPATYIQMVNDLMGIEVIRQHYQFWAFRYPTGLPMALNVESLRKSLLDAQKTFDPAGTNPNFNKMVIIGHSMGGILSRAMLEDSGEVLYNSMFTVPIDKLDLTAQERARLESLIYFKRLPFISRAIFIASPLKGSDVAKRSIAERLARMFITLPTMWVSSRAAVLKKNKEYLVDGVKTSDFIDVPRSSVSNLSSDSPVIKALDLIPLPTDLPYHSIIAIQEFKEGPGSDDQLVKYESAHLDGAKSELLVPEWHSCLEHPMTIAEVRRILLQHLSEAGIK